MGDPRIAAMSWSMHAGPHPAGVVSSTVRSLHRGVAGGIRERGSSERSNGAMTWRRRKGTEAAAERARVEAEVAGREAVRVAEQLVSSTWVAQLLRSEQNARDAVRAYRHLRAAAANGLREAQIAGHPQLVARRQAEVENLDVALADSTEYCDAVAATVGT